jgi:YD repeat-containing protein
MEITYDAATDTITVVLRDAPARISEEERSGVILDYDASGRLIASRSSMPRPASTGSTPSSFR